MQRNRAYAAEPFQLSQGQQLVWQDSGEFFPSGQLHCCMGADTLQIAVNGLEQLEPRLHGLTAFVPSEALTMMVEHALAPVLDLLERLSSQPIRCDSYRRLDTEKRVKGSHNDPSIGIRIGWMLRLQDPNNTEEKIQVRGWIHAPAALWNSIDFCGNQPDSPDAPALAQTRLRAVPLWLSAQLGSGQLSFTELHALTIGDALRITPALRPAQRRCLPVQLRSWDDRWCAQAFYVATELILQTPMRPTMTDIPTLALASASTTSSGPALQALSHIECELRFEIGSLRMSCGDVAKLRAGRTIPLHTRLQDQPITVLVHGQAIARGELVAVGDELMVVLTQTQGLPER
jgi:type III secretion system YscQ/HrcQ family protein